MLMPTMQATMDTGWVGTTMALSLLVIALAFIVMAAAVGLTLGLLRNQLEQVAGALKDLNSDLSQVLKGARHLAEDGQRLAQLAREEGEAYLASSRRIRKKLDRGVDRLSERLDNFDALVEVVHDEVEETALRFATTLRAARLSTAVLGRVLRRRRR
jgi:methyl-accepting chemotaxis protein